MNAIRLRESTPCFPDGASEGVRFVESENGKTVSFQNVAVLGLESANLASDGKPRRYNLESVQKAIPLYEGAQVGLDHADGWTGPSVDRLAGKIVGVKWNESRGKLMADQLVIQRTPRTEHVLAMMTAQPEHLGLSHDVSAAEMTHGDGPDEHLELHVSKVWSVDVVRHPATNRNLFESRDEVNLRFSEDEAGELDLGGATRRGWKVQSGGRLFLVLEGGEDQNPQPQNTMNKDPEGTAEERLAALEARVEAAEARADAAETRASEAESKLSRQAVEARVAESRLPEKAKEKILRASEGKDLDEVDAMVEAEIAYLQELGLVTESEDDDDGGDEPAGEPKREAAVRGAGPDQPQPRRKASRDSEIESEFRSLVGSQIGLSGDNLVDFVGRKKEGEA